MQMQMQDEHHWFLRNSKKDEMFPKKSRTPYMYERYAF